jgi:coenzyme F420-reducing hydrogenase delta subunit
MTTTLTKTSVKVAESRSTWAPKAVIQVFHCFNAINSFPEMENDDYEVRSLKLPCSSMTREVSLLRAFEAGADAVVVLVCPEGACDYLEGNTRARKRVERVKKILDEIGIGGKRLNIYNMPRHDVAEAQNIIQQTIFDLEIIGRNPAALI